MESPGRSSLALLLAAGIWLLGGGCVTAASYPIRHLDAGEWDVSGEAGMAYPNQPRGQLQVYRGIGGTGDVGIHAGIDFTMPDFVFAGGLSYRHYIEEWVRLAVDATYHHATGSIGPVYDEDVSLCGIDRSYIPCATSDDFAMSRFLFEFARVHRIWGIRGGPLVRTGSWFPDPGRFADEAPDAYRIRGGWLGVQTGGFFGAALFPAEWLSIRADFQALFPVIPEPQDRNQVPFHYDISNALRWSLGLGFRF